MENKLSLVKNNFGELPNNIEAEQAVIGSILVSNEASNLGLYYGYWNLFFY